MCILKSKLKFYKLSSQRTAEFVIGFSGFSKKGLENEKFHKKKDFAVMGIQKYDEICQVSI